MDDHDQRAFKILQQNGKMPGLYIDELFEKYNVDSDFNDYNEDGRLLRYEDIENYHEE